MLAATQELFGKKEVKKKYFFLSQVAGYKSATQLKTAPPPATDILQIPHPDLELYLNVLEIQEDIFFKKPLNDCLLLKKEENK